MQDRIPLNQCDILNYINKELDKTQDVILDILEKITGIRQTHLSERVTNSMDGYKELTDKSEEIYEKFFMCLIEGQPEEKELEKIKNWLINNNLRFLNSEGTADDTFETYVKRMLSCGLSNRRKRNTSPSVSRKKKKTKTSEGAFLRMDIFSGVPGFIGRESEMKEIKEKLEKYHAAVIHGMAGMGKSSIAEEFARREIQNHNYDRVQRIIFSMEDFPDLSFNSLMLALKFDNLTTDGLKDDEILSRKLEALRSSAYRNLIIIDNIDTLLRDVKTFDVFRSSSNAHFILTTRRDDLFEANYVIKDRLSPLNDEDLMTLLEDGSRYSFSEKDKKDIHELFCYLESNTFLVKLIAKSIKNSAQSPAEILVSLKNNDEELPLLRTSKDGRIYENGTLLDMFYRIVFRGNVPVTDEQIKILKLLSFMPTGGISKSLCLSLLKSGKAEVSFRDTQKSFNELEHSRIIITEKKSGCGIITRLNPIISTIIKIQYYKSDIDCGECVENLCALAEGDSHSADDSEILKMIHGITNIHAVCSMERTKMIACFKVFLKFVGGHFPEKLCEMNLLIGRVFRELNDNEALKYLACARTVEEGEIYGLACLETGTVYWKNSEYDDAEKYIASALKHLTRQTDIASAEKIRKQIMIDRNSEL